MRQGPPNCTHCTPKQGGVTGSWTGGSLASCSVRRGKEEPRRDLIPCYWLGVWVVCLVYVRSVCRHVGWVLVTETEEDLARNSEFRHVKADSTYTSRGGHIFWLFWEARRGGEVATAASWTIHFLLPRKHMSSLLPRLERDLCMFVFNQANLVLPPPVLGLLASFLLERINLICGQNSPKGHSLSLMPFADRACRHTSPN